MKRTIPNEIAKKIFFVIIPLLISAVFASCYNEDDDIPLIIEPDLWNVQLTITENKKSDSGITVYTETYNYSHFVALASCNTQQSIGTLNMSNNYETMTDQARTARTYTDEIGNEWIYTLSASNYFATHAIYRSGEQERTYDFTYTNNDQLSTITEHIDGIQFSHIKFNYIDSQNATMTIGMHGNTEVAHITYIKEPQWIVFPNYFLIEQYPLNLHRVAFYDGVLGINYHIIGSIQYEGSDEITTFAYNDNLTETTIVPQYCEQTITGNGYSDTRRVNYTLAPLYTK